SPPGYIGLQVQGIGYACRVSKLPVERQALDQERLSPVIIASNLIEPGSSIEGRCSHGLLHVIAPHQRLLQEVQSLTEVTARIPERSQCPSQAQGDLFAPLYIL